MKMKPAITIAVLVGLLALAAAQSPSVIQNTRNTMNGVSSRAAAASNQALGAHGNLPPAASAPSSAKAGPAADDEQAVVPDNKNSANGRRDPFISPVVSHAGGSGCSTGKKCLEIGTINLRGVVRSDGGFIAVVSNGLNKAYFLRENDPVFNGYVVKITGDSIVFQETLQDRLGKTFTREVVKKITTPAV
jgi:Tfp pilus assembly protein PilP